MIRIFRVVIPGAVALVLLVDLAITLLSYLFAAHFFSQDLEIFLFFEDGLARIGIATGTVILCLYFQDMYGKLRVESRIMAVQHVVMAVGIVLLTQAVLAYGKTSLLLPRPVVFLGSSILVTLLALWRIVYAEKLLGAAIAGDRVIFLGTSPLSIDLANRLAKRPELGMAVVGFVDDFLSPAAEQANIELLGQTGAIRSISAEYKPARIVVGMAERRQSLPVFDLLALRFEGIRIEEVATTYEAAFGRVPIQQLRPSQLIFSPELGPIPRQLRLQLIYSTLIGLIGFVISAPIMVLVAIAVKLTSRGPILFRQKRVGLNGKEFWVYKFRSMVVDAEAKSGAVWAKKNDPRVTGIGKYLRKLRLDELPQLFNVLRGDMSVVGPRPERPEFVRTLSEQIPFYRQRHYVRPGITGWAQINHKYGDTIEDTIIKLEYDLYYIKNLSVSLDLYIMFHTVKVMLFSQSGQ